MNVNTMYFGTISYTPEDIVSIPEGLFGFEGEQEYLLIHFNEENNTLLCLQSLENENLAFVLTNPFCMLPDYRPTLSKDDMKALNLSEESEVTFYSICVIRDKLEDSTVNLKCPIVINSLTRQARQIILDDASYTFKHPFIQPSDTPKGGEYC